MFGFGKRKVPVKKTQQGSHGDHWSAVFGFDDQDSMQQHVHSIISDLAVEKSISAKVTRVVARYGVLSALGLQSKNRLLTLYPMLDTPHVVPVTIKEVLEWRHVDGLEAQVRGSGRSTFGLDFFATDYAENRATYRNGGELDVALAGMAYVLEQSSSLPDNFAADVCAYLPNTDMPYGHDYNFTGDVLSEEEVQLKGERLNVFQVKLINAPEVPSMFNLPILANVRNIRGDPIEVGDKVSGCFWLQGSINR